MDWTFTEDRPIWQQLTEQITLRILKGTYLPGDKLPAVRELAAQAGVNPNTMQRALAQLEADGLVVRREYLEVPVRVEYEIAPRCRSLIPILDDLGRWCDSLPAVSGGVTNGGPGPADNGGAAL